jgi:hypothetical protein
MASSLLLAVVLLAILLQPVLVSGYVGIESLMFLSLSCLSMCALHWASVDGYTQSQPKLIGSGAGGNARQGISTAISGDGLTACVGGYYDSSSVGAVWFYTRADAVTFTWMQQGSKVVPNDNTGAGCFGYSCSLSFNGRIAVVGGYNDNNGIGATWIITRDGGGVWAQQGAKRVGTGYTGTSVQGVSISLASTAANVYVAGGYFDNSFAGIA